jgi:hypothetical protein
MIIPPIAAIAQYLNSFAALAQPMPKCAEYALLLNGLGFRIAKAFRTRLSLIEDKFVSPACGL